MKNKSLILSLILVVAFVFNFQILSADIAPVPLDPEVPVAPPQAPLPPVNPAPAPTPDPSPEPILIQPTPIPTKDLPPTSYSIVERPNNLGEGVTPVPLNNYDIFGNNSQLNYSLPIVLCCICIFGFLIIVVIIAAIVLKKRRDKKS